MVGTGIALPATLPGTPPRVHPSPYPAAEHVHRRRQREHVPAVNMAVGLKSVEQLSLSDHFSGFQGMTEVYNLLRIRRINNHSFIPGFD